MSPYIKKIEDEGFYNRTIIFDDFNDIIKIVTYLDAFIELSKKQIQQKLLGSPLDPEDDSWDFDTVNGRKYWLFRPEVFELVQEAIEYLWENT